MLKAAGFAIISALISAGAGFAQTISGAVTTPAGEPVRGAALRLIFHPNMGAGASVEPQVYSVFSDAKGNYTFEDLAPEAYLICSDKPGYLYECYADSAKRDVFDLAPGQKLTGIDIKMTPQAVISGRVTDENGDPLVNVDVYPVRWRYWRAGRQLLPAGAGSSSNTEGEFSIGGLEAGVYYLLVQQWPPQNVISRGPQETYMATYYPGVADPAKAVSVRVAAGGAVRGIEIRMIKTRAYRVRGKLPALPSEAAPQTPQPPMNVRLTPEDEAFSNTVGAVPEGTFEFPAVLPGAYLVEVRAQGGFARQKVVVGSADVDDVVLRFAPYPEVTGTISIEGAALPPQSKPIVQIGDMEFPSENGTFAIRSLTPGTYHVDVQALPPGSYVKSIHLGDRDVTKAPFDLTSGNSETLNIVLSPKAGEIVAMVHDADGLIRPAAFVSLWTPGWTPGLPTEDPLDFTRTEVTDRDGKFKFTNLAPGDYRIAAWDGYEGRSQAMVPEVRSKLDSQAAAVKLEEGEHASVDAPLIGLDVIEAEVAKLP